ncbi:MAG: BatA domain-containing protein [Cryomorphaceae bacterium]
MVFTSPLVLWALTLISLPIAIHLFQFRRYKKLYFSDVSLLKEVRSTSQTKNQLKHWIILLSRILFVGLLVTAFAEPMIPSINRTEANSRVSIYLDNSFSMQASEGSGNLLQHALQAGYDISNSFPRQTRFQLITNDFSAQEKRFTDADEFIALLDEVGATAQHRTLAELTSFQQQSIIGNHEKVKTFLLSDFNRVLDSSKISWDTLNELSIMPFSAGIPANVSIDSVWLRTPITQLGTEQVLNIRIRNHSLVPVQNLSVQVVIEGEALGTLILDLPAKMNLDTSMVFLPSAGGFIKGEVFLEDYPVSFDNNYFFNVFVTEVIEVVEIVGPDIVSKTPFQRLFDGNSFRYQRFSQDEIKQQLIEEAQVLILNEPTALSTGLTALVAEKLATGGNVLLVLPQNATKAFKTTLNEAFAIDVRDEDTTQLSVNRINGNHFLFDNVFDSPLINANLPHSNFHQTMASNQRGESILTLFNGESLLWTKRISNGNIFVVTSPLRDGFTDFHRHALFVPAMFNIAAHAGIGKPLAHKVNAKLIITNSRIEEARMQRLDDSTSFIPGLSHNGILLGEKMIQPGHYAFISGDSIMEVFSFNFDRNESEIDPPSISEIETYFADRQIAVKVYDETDEDLSLEVTEANIGTQLWPIFALLALMVLILETVLLKLFSK